MRELNINEMEQVNGGWLNVALAALTIIGAIDVAIDAYRGYTDGYNSVN